MTLLIICNGMPRSGSTANYNLLREYFEVVVDLNILGFYSADRLNEEAHKLRELARSKDFFLIKTHEFLPKILNEGVEAGEILHLYSVRDIREVAVSMKRVWGFSDSKVFTSLDHHSDISLRMSTLNSVKILRYENMLQKGSDILADSSEYFRIPFSQEAATKAIRNVDELKKSNKSIVKIRVMALWQKLVRNVNRQIRVGKFLKLFFSRETVSRWRDNVTLVDSRTMLHPAHVGVSSPVESSERISRMFDRKYQNWIVHFGYQK